MSNVASAAFAEWEEVKAQADFKRALRRIEIGLICAYWTIMAGLGGFIGWLCWLIWGAK